MKNGVHITHNDADALGCALVTQYIPEHAFETYSCRAGDADSVVFNPQIIDPTNLPDFILISDISISDEAAKYLENLKANFKENMNLLLIDHHPTNKLGEKYPWCIVGDDPTVSAAELLYGYFNQLASLDDVENLADIITDISRYDTWQWKKNPDELDPYHEEDYNIYLKLFDFYVAFNKISSNLKMFGNAFTPSDIDLINGYKAKREASIERVSKVISFIDFDIYKLGVVILDNEFGNEKLEYIYSNFDVDISMGIYPTSKTFSFRTNKSHINLSEFSQKFFGGGGHPSAAGARVKTDTLLEWLEKYYRYQDDKEKETK